jgi:hypothetical protein
MKTIYRFQNSARQIFALFILSAATLSAQEPSKNFHFAPKTGAAISTNKAGSNYGDAGARTSYYIGVAGIYNPGKIGAEIELQYSAGGHTDHPELNLNSFTAIPSLRYQPTHNLALKCGPFFSGFTSVEMDGKDVSDSFTSGDAGIHLGFEYRIYQNLFLEARYLFGLQNISEIDANDFIGSGWYNPTLDGSIDLDYRTRMLQIGISYQF